MVSWEWSLGTLVGYGSRCREEIDGFLIVRSPFLTFSVCVNTEALTNVTVLGGSTPTSDCEQQGEPSVHVVTSSPTVEDVFIQCLYGLSVV